MGERKGVNKYYPPDFDPGKGGLNKYHGTHALRERARKLHEGILIIRFEMPYNIWCNGCGNHIGMGVRYNAQKRKVGNYYTTPIYKFRMKCHLCDQHFEIQTDPKNCEYVILSGAKRKEERWDPAVTENIQTTDRDVKAKLVSDAMYKLEHSILDKQVAKKKAPTLGKLRDIRDVWHDDFAVNQALRRKFRQEKMDINTKKAVDEDLKKRALLPSSMPLVDESPEDADLPKRIKYGEGDIRPDLKRRKRKLEIKRSSIFESHTSSKEQLARHVAGLAKVRQTSTNSLATINTITNPGSVEIITKTAKNESESSGRHVSSCKAAADIASSLELSVTESTSSLLREEKNKHPNCDESDLMKSSLQHTELLEQEMNSVKDFGRGNSSMVVAYSSSSESSDG